MPEDQNSPFGRKHLWLQLLTATRIPLAITFAAILTRHSSVKSGLICLGLLAAIEITDAVDGWIARRYGLESTWGKGFDPYADSFARLVVYWALAIDELVWPQVPLVMALRDLTVAYARIASTRANASIAARSSGKLKAAVQGAGAFVVTSVAVFGSASSIDWNPSALVSVGVIVVTIGSAVDYSTAAWSALGTKKPRQDDR